MEKVKGEAESSKLSVSEILRERMQFDPHGSRLMWTCSSIENHRFHLASDKRGSRLAGQVKAKVLESVLLCPTRQRDLHPLDGVEKLTINSCRALWIIVYLHWICLAKSINAFQQCSRPRRLVYSTSRHRLPEWRGFTSQTPPYLLLQAAGDRAREERQRRPRKQSAFLFPKFRHAVATLLKKCSKAEDLSGKNHEIGGGRLYPREKQLLQQPAKQDLDFQPLMEAIEEQMELSSFRYFGFSPCSVLVQTAEQE
mmetsp:Transcript_34277/g.134417  ORF Transcript_34277/g.134417 Transcript_34277/m.134417 type:complete len:254 (+) Transcript_34277:1027-1788(+)